MNKSVFFVPADRPSFICKITHLNSTDFVLDLEESVSDENKELCFINLKNLVIKDNYGVRLSINYQNIKSNTIFFTKLYNLGFRLFVLPKLNTLSDFESLISENKKSGMKDIKYAIMVETPLCLLSIKEIVERYVSKISYIAIGSHDYCNIIGCKHNNENLLYLRLKLLSICKAFNIPIIDIVSTEIKDINKLEVECVDSFNMGFDGKALIHPNQLIAFNKANYYNLEEIIEAKEVINQIQQIDATKFSIVEVNGKIFEKPHLKRINNIIEWSKKNKEVI